MKKSIYEKYAHLLVNYSLYLKKGESVYVKSTWLAEPLLQEFYKEALKAGAHVEFSIDFEDKDAIFYENASEEQLKQVSPFHKTALETFDAYLNIQAPFNLRSLQNADRGKMNIYSQAFQPISNTYSERTANGQMKRSLCQFPTAASAQNAGMSLRDYEDFIFASCFLYEEDPAEKWRELGRNQQKVVDLLNQRTTVRYVNPGTDITFSTKGRTWINSDGKANMPSGEVFTSPVEDSVNGFIHFDFPSIYSGNEVEGITLEVKDGEVIKWRAKRGEEFLDKIFQVPGAKFFGEAAIATNYGITRPTKNILFDEKIGGTVHMAIGQSYLHAGGKNQSSVHWDMIADMKTGGKIYADGELIYENGQFTF
jgi:aminopeptidase